MANPNDKLEGGVDPVAEATPLIKEAPKQDAAPAPRPSTKVFVPAFKSKRLPN